MPDIVEIPRPNPNSLPPAARGIYWEAGLSPGGPIFLTLGDSVGLTGLNGLKIKLKDLRGDLQGSKNSQAFQVEVYDKADPPVLHHREVTELRRVGDQIIEHTVIVPADQKSGRRVIRDVIADANTFQISSIRLSNEKGQQIKTVIRRSGDPNGKFKIEEFDPEEGYVRHAVVVDIQNRPSFENTEFREYYPQAGKVKRLKSRTSNEVEYAGDEAKTVAAKFVRKYHYAKDGKTELYRFVENTIIPSTHREEDLYEIQEKYCEISDDGQGRIIESVTEIYRPHDAQQLSSSKRWREVSGKARRGNNFLRLESTVREIAYTKNGKEARDESRTIKWQYNEEDQLIAVKVESNLIPEYADYMFYKPGQELPYARLRWDSHKKQYILYATDSIRDRNERRGMEEGYHGLSWDFSWIEVDHKEVERVNLIPDYATASTIMQDMTVTTRKPHSLR